MKAYRAFAGEFRKAKLEQIYESHIATSRAVGRDGIRSNQFKDSLDSEIELIGRRVTSGTYQFAGYKEKLISKGASKIPRQISIPTFRDRLTLRALNNVLATVFPESKSTNPHAHIRKIWNISSVLPAGHCYLRIDIKNYYPSILHDQLLIVLQSKIRKPEILHLIKQAIQTPTGKRNCPGNENLRGIPQAEHIKYSFINLSKAT